MFKRQIYPHVLEISHKIMESPEKSVYFNHIHNHCEILLFVSGKAEYNIDGQIFKPAPYDLLFIPAATYHYLIPTDTVPYENYVIGFDPAMIDEVHYRRLFSAPLMINIREDSELMGFFTRLDRYDKTYLARDFSVCALALIIELMSYCSHVKGRLQGAHSGRTRLIEQMVKYIQENIKKPLDAATIARQFHLSASYVQNTFSQNMHIGLKKYIQQKKIYLAHADIMAGMPPGLVCQKYAFSEYSSFYRLYKSTFGYAPTGKNRPQKGE